MYFILLGCFSMYFILLIFSLFFSWNSFAQNSCHSLFQFQKGEVAAESDVSKRFLQNAEMELKSSLQNMGKSLQEPRLEQDGFTPEYYEGFDKAGRLKRVQTYLQEIQADSEKTHISFFSGQVEQIVSYFERAFRGQTERLRLLEDLKKEAQKRITNQELTYDWWLNFNFRLVLLSTPENEVFDDLGLVFTDSESYAKRKKEIFRVLNINNLIDLAKTDTAMGNFIDQASSLSFIRVKDFQTIKEAFPEVVLFFTTDEPGIMAFNRMGSHSHFITVSPYVKGADGRTFSPLGFFLHDVAHGHEAYKYSKYDSKREMIEKNKEIQERLNNIPNQADREKAELALFLFRHELGFEFYISALFSEIVEQKQSDGLLNDDNLTYLRSRFPGGLKDEFDKTFKTHFPDKDSLINRRKELLNNVMRKFYFSISSPRFIREVRHLWPRYLQTSIDEDQIQSFLDEMADIFNENFSEILAR